MRGIRIPMFTIGDDDGHAVEEFTAMANGTGIKTHLRWDSSTIPI